MQFADGKHWRGYLSAMGRGQALGQVSPEESLGHLDFPQVPLHLPWGLRPSSPPD